MGYPSGMELHGSAWRVTKRVPKDLLRHYPSAFLRFPTGEPDKKAAALKAWRWITECEEEFQRLRLTGSRFRKSITDAEADRLCALATASRLVADEEGRDLGHEWELQAAGAALVECDSAEREAIAGRSLAGVSEQAQDWLLGHGFDLDTSSQEFRSFARQFAKAQQRASKAVRQRDAGDWVETPEAAAPLPGSGRPIAPLLSTVIAYHLGKQDRDAPMFKKQEAALALFLEVIGDRSVDSVRQQEIEDFCALLCRLPPRWADVRRKRGIGAAVIAGMEWPSRISRATFEDGYMAMIRPFLVEARRVFGDQGFPRHLTTEGIKYSGARERGERMQRALRPDELKRLYEGPEFAAFASDPAKEHCYWLPLIGLYTGARVNEVCQLNPQHDIREESGVWFFDFTEDTEGDSRIRKSIKNAGSGRRVPIHSRLMGLGFLSYVDRMKNAGAALLFPQWSPTRGRASGQAEKWFRKLLSALQLRDDTPRSRIVGFHCFRHTFLNRAMHLDIANAEWLTGHAPAEVSKVVRAYQGQAELTKKRELMERLSYDISPPPIAPVA